VKGVDEMKRAAIYIRVSSERQGEKVSPKAQEKDCKSYCEEREYLVVDTYQDIKRYRSKGKMVEPSGTRNDRPEFTRMLSEIDKGDIDVIIAWREDRLYRGVNRAMLEINERVTEKKVEVELVKEHYDPTIATVKAWAAGVELQAKRDRFMMGMAARLAKGKPLNHPPPYGYSKDDDGYYVENPEESVWIKRLFEWYGDEVPIIEIRRRFITGGAKQRQDTVRFPWNLGILRDYLKSEYYWTGNHLVKWGDETYEIPAPKLVSLELAQKAANRRARYKRYPEGNAKHSCLIAGIVYCAHCGVKMTVISNREYVKKDGTKGKYVYYGCPYYSSYVKKECARRINSHKVDTEVWERVWSLLSQEEELEKAIQIRIDELNSQEINAEAKCKKLDQELDDLALERQKVITFARKGIISDEDLETQLLALSFDENVKRRELEETQLLLGNRAERLIQLAERFREQVNTGILAINGELESPELSKRQFEVRKKIVQEIVKRVEIDRDRKISIDAVIALPEFLSISEPATMSC
jgi:DNA invertase Pin-like site-specific DNA recombinase